ncbi:MAG: energy-coupling factor ABC transporter permease [Nitrospiraceae bacterium]|nr:energy-coupling factor ABC transporter permease [Nitrospiraceae bacterium]
MTHMHIPDGILPVWLWLSGFLLMAALLAASLVRLRGVDRMKKIPLLGAMAAAMLVSMSLEILPLAYHLNLSVATGILLGPALGFVAAFIVNLMLALMGHGGITVIGLNTLLLGAEAVMGHFFFYLLPKRMPVFWRAASATVAALLLASLLLIGVVAVSSVNAEAFSHEHGHERGNALDHGTEAPETVKTFAVIVLTLGSLGWIIEGTITGAVIRFISQVKPDLLSHVLHVKPGPEAGGGNGR